MKMLVFSLHCREEIDRQRVHLAEVERAEAQTTCVIRHAALLHTRCRLAYEIEIAALQKEYAESQRLEQEKNAKKLKAKASNVVCVRGR